MSVESQAKQFGEPEWFGLVRKAYEKKYGEPLPRLTVQDIEDWNKKEKLVRVLKNKKRKTSQRQTKTNVSPVASKNCVGRLKSMANL